ncbi:DUF3854 domain-containing protein [Oculatella sp. FACHB-28]|uniref:plasmid replication protein, CyRepA1 family n=1 Tax=Oculatella sp. FACHB-28 TaxID=2692845 RepID=UPI0016836B8E|nr:plasmid replication protein, CyRepA1 family [Oculatella sp. FACHB-28]MBD2055295.1 DUF3854 domain-containing protein [Oculatella sp. FACHB-28]
MKISYAANFKTVEKTDPQKLRDRETFKSTQGRGCKITPPIKPGVAIVPAPKTLTPSLEQFSHKIKQEFIQGSAIDPELYRTAVSIVCDVEPTEAGDVFTPIHEALNWQYTRFGYQVKESFQAALILNEDGSTWQAKLSNPRWDTKKGKQQKYETPVSNGSKAYLPPVPTSIRQRISTRFGVEVPLDGSFWQWLEKHPEIPVVLTEGAKKALSLLSLGYVAIAFYGVNGGYSTKDRLGNPIDPSLIPDLERFATEGRRTCLAFDQDEKFKTQRRVNTALTRFGSLLKAAGCDVAIALWDGEQGKAKGVDDLITTRGADAWHQAHDGALSLEHWKIWQRLENRLTYSAALRVSTADLSTLQIANLPEQGIIAIASSKGSGKTKFLGSVTGGAEKVIAAGHRTALMRNLCDRLQLGYRGDLDKVAGEFINGCAYTLRVGLCVDSLLAIDPSRFAGCDLILDEVVQVVRHLLTSSTCQKEGKRPALLARFRELIQAARRVLLADADLDNATLNYIQELRGDNSSVFLIRNDYTATGYPVRFIQSPDQTTVIGELLQAVRQLEAGKVLMVCTDNKGKAIARLIAKESPQKRVLLINSETSGSECEREFIQSPDIVLERGEYDVIIASPSMATGVSIETQGVISQVFGIFTGGSSTDADMAQALGRARESVERIVWCAKRGSNFSKVSRSTHALEVKSHLQSRTSATVRLVRSGLREDTVEAISSYDWQTDPHVNLFSRISAAQNFSMHSLNTALLVRLRYEGNRVQVEDHCSNSIVKALLRDAKDELRQMDAVALINAPQLTYSDILLLEQRETLSPEEQLALSRFYLADFYCLDTLTVEDVLWDEAGRRRGELLSLEAQLYPGMAIDFTAKTLQKQASWNRGICPWDISGSELRRALRAKLGLETFLNPDREWTKYDLEEVANVARQLATQVKVALNFTVSSKVSDTQIVHQLLSQMGVKTVWRWSRSVKGHKGEKLRVYRLDIEHWQRVTGILKERKARRERFTQDSAAPGSSPQLCNQNTGDDPIQNRICDPDQPVSLESPGNVKELLASTTTSESIEELEQGSPSWFPLRREATSKNLSRGFFEEA